MIKQVRSLLRCSGFRLRRLSESSISPQRNRGEGVCTGDGEMSAGDWFLA
jgi:hypothetical protein